MTQEISKAKRRESIEALLKQKKLVFESPPPLLFEEATYERADIVDALQYAAIGIDFAYKPGRWKRFKKLLRKLINKIKGFVS